MLNRKWIIFILGALCTISPFAIDMYLPAFPSIADGLDTTTAKVSLSISSYFVGFALGQILYGPLLDRFGRKLPLYVGLVLFIVCSAICIWVPDVSWLIAIRFLQALGGCVAQVAAMAMVRDFFPVKDTAKIISLLILILGVSPLLAPTIGGFVSIHFGWQAVFVILSVHAFIMLIVCWRWLPEGHPPDASVSLRPAPILANFIFVLKERQFITYAMAGAFAFAGLLVYVAGSPIMFMEVFDVEPSVFGAIFAGLSVGFIGSNQINVLLLRRFTSDQIFRGALLVECPAAILFLVGTIYGWFGLASTVALLFVILFSLGLAYPNAAALAMAPFDRNIGSASAMLGFLQVGVSSIASASIGLFDSQSVLPIAFILALTSCLGFAILIIGKRKIPQLKFLEESGANPVVH